MKVRQENVSEKTSIREDHSEGVKNEKHNVKHTSHELDQKAL
jgi:hypothetical protein